MKITIYPILLFSWKVQRPVRRAFLRQPALLDEQGEPLARLALAEPKRAAHDAAGEITMGGEILRHLAP